MKQRVKERAKEKEKMENNETLDKKTKHLSCLEILYVFFVLLVCVGFAAVTFGITGGNDPALRLKCARYLYFSFVTGIFFFPFHTSQNGAESYHPPIFSILCIFNNAPNGKTLSQSLVAVLALLLVAMGADIPKIVFGE